MTQQTLQDSIHDWQSEEGITDATMVAGQIEILTEAVQALAYEQRTANLLAFERSQWEAWRQDELKPEGVELWSNAANQIIERLGLK